MIKITRGDAIVTCEAAFIDDSGIVIAGSPLDLARILAAREKTPRSEVTPEERARQDDEDFWLSVMTSPVITSMRRRFRREEEEEAAVRAAQASRQAS